MYGMSAPSGLTAVEKCFLGDKEEAKVLRVRLVAKGNILLSIDACA